MKVKKLLAGMLSAAMVLSTMVMPAFADDSTDTDVYEIGVGKQYGNLRDAVKDAVDADNDGQITYKLFGKNTLTATSGTEWYSLKGASNASRIDIVAGDDDAELVLSNTGNAVIIIGIQNAAADGLALNFDGLTLSRENAKWTEDIAQATEMFTAFVRKDNTVVNYTDCTFPQGVYNNQYGKTNFKNCTFGSDDGSTKYGLWISPDKQTNPNTVSVSESTFYGSVKIYGQGSDNTTPMTTNIENSKFKNITKKPGIVSNQKGTVNITNTTFDCALGNVANLTHEKNQTATEAIAEITIDGKVPEYKAFVNGSLFTDFSGAYEYAENSKPVEAVVAQIGSNCYTNLADAVAAAQSGDTVKLLSDENGKGIQIPSGKNITIDFGGHTYNIGDPTVGSPGTETNGFQLLKDSTIVFKNGSIYTNKAYILIQNYANLTLENMNLNLETVHPTGTQLVTLSNNNGDTVLTGNTNIKALSNNIAFDIYGGWYPSYPSVSVTLDDKMTGTIDGDILVSNGELAAPDKFKLLIKNGTVNGEIKDNRTAEQKAAYPNLEAISGGTFSTDVTAYCVPGYSAKLVDGKYVVDNITNKITLKFEPTSDKKVYNIVLSGGKENINRLSTADFTFDFTTTGKMSYAVAEKDGVNLTNPSENRYAFNFNGKDAADETGKEITLGTVTFDGYGTFSFGVKDVDTNIVHAAKSTDNIVEEFVVGGGTGKGTLDVSANLTDVKLEVPKNKLTINVTFPNAVAENAADYQQMKVTIVGGETNETVALGTDEQAMVNGEYSFTKELPENTPYTVTVSGAGYRTARYTVTLNGDKTLNFWNNAKDNAVEVEVGNENSKKAVTFLAGDIVKDNDINIYDLSAVVSYFGTDNLVENHKEYAKYDLNRDGKIDSKDVAYVLVSWGK